MEDFGGIEGVLLSDGFRGMEGGASEPCLSMVLPLGRATGCWGRGFISGMSFTSIDCEKEILQERSYGQSS